MRVNILCDFRCYRLQDGSIWTTTPFRHGFWCRYLAEFSDVSVFARTSDVSNLPPAAGRVDGENVTVRPIPLYQTLSQYLRNRTQIRQCFSQVQNSREAVILRAPSHLANLGWRMAIPCHGVFGVEVVGDPYDVFSTGIGPWFMRRAIRHWFTRCQQKQCKEATGVAYVTQRYLQQRYPSSKNAFTTHYSSIELPADAIAERPKTFSEGVSKIVTVGSLDQLYKGTDVLIEAVALLIRSGMQISLSIVGDGRYRSELQSQAESAAIANFVHFVGEVSAGEAVRAQLDSANLFVLPSRTEGLPRAMIEALARGLPCVGTRVGGIPELIEDNALVASGNAKDLAERIRHFLTSPDDYNLSAKNSLSVAARYSSTEISQRRNNFYRSLREATDLANQSVLPQPQHEVD